MFFFVLGSRRLLLYFYFDWITCSLYVIDIFAAIKLLIYGCNHHLFTQHFLGSQALDALLVSLDTRGIRESHLHIMLQKIEVPFRELARKNLLGANVVGHIEKKIGNEVADLSTSPGSNDGTESPNSTVCGTSSESLEPSSSFKIELGRNDRERENALNRYQDLQIWMWKESFNSSILRGMNYGKKQRIPLLGICNLCLDSFMIEDGYCPSCHTTTTKLENGECFFEKCFEEKLKNEPMNFIVSNGTRPLRIRVMKALLICLEVRIIFLPWLVQLVFPSSLLHPDWLISWNFSVS